MIRLARDEALARLSRETRTRGCLICALRDGDGGRLLPIARTTASIAVLSRYPRHWGHCLILFRRHATRFGDLDKGAWADATALAARVAAALERTLSPSRVYVASLGTERTDLPMSSPHLHLHVVPVPDASLRPADVFSWSSGVLSADEPQWQRLRQQLASSISRAAARTDRDRCRSPR